MLVQDRQSSRGKLLKHRILRIAYLPLMHLKHRVPHDHPYILQVRLILEIILLIDIIERHTSAIPLLQASHEAAPYTGLRQDILEIHSHIHGDSLQPLSRNIRDAELGDSLQYLRGNPGVLAVCGSADALRMPVPYLYLRH